MRIIFNGGKFPPNDKEGKAQKAIVEMVCDHNRTGLEGDEEDKRPTEDKRRKRDESASEENGGDEKDTPSDPSLTLVSYKTEDNVGVLRLNWRTKYACERDTDNDNDNDGDLPKKGGWGFFTWFLIMYVFSRGCFMHLLLTVFPKQSIPCNIRLPHFRLLAKLQPLWGTWVGPATSR